MIMTKRDKDRLKLLWKHTSKLLKKYYKLEDKLDYLICFGKSLYKENELKIKISNIQKHLYKIMEERQTIYNEIAIIYGEYNN